MSAEPKKPRETKECIRRSLDDGPFLWESHASVIRARSAAGANGLALLVGLAARAPIDGTDFKASMNNLAEASALSLRTVHRVLPVLVRARVVAMESGRGRGDAGGDVANTFRLLRVTLAFAEGGTDNPVHPRVPDSHTRVQSQLTSLAEDREISAASRERSLRSPAAPAPAGAAPGHGGGGVDQNAFRPMIDPEDLK